MKTRPELEFENLLKELPDAQLAALMREYVSESNHNSWDGFERHHMTGIRALFTDIGLYHNNGSKP